MSVLSDASADPCYNYDPRVNILFFDASSPPNWRGYIYFLICLSNRSREATSYFQNQLCEPLLVDDGHGLEVLDQGTAHGNENWDTLDYE